MDNIVAESNDTMINSLNFGLPETSQYITDRRFVNYFPSGSNVYAPNAGNKNIRFYLSGDDNTYLDLSSIRVFATVQNTDTARAKFLRPLAGLHGFLSRYRATVGGQLVQDIIEYNRHCELYNSFKPKDVRDMDDIENSANPRWDSDYHDYAIGLENLISIVDFTPNGQTEGTTSASGADAANTKVNIRGNKNGDRNDFGRTEKQYTRHSLTGIPGANGKARFSHKPCCGLLESNYYLPLRYAPLELEFTIVPNEGDPVVVPTAAEVAGQTDEFGYFFTNNAGVDAEGTTTTKWELNNVIIRAEVITLDNTVNNNIVSHLLGGSSLKLAFPMYHTITQTFNNAGTEINMNIVKSSSKLTGAFITLYRTPRQGVMNLKYLPDNYIYKRWNYFYNNQVNARINDSGDAGTPDLQGKGFQDYGRNLSWQIQLGNKKYPEFESQSLSETFYYLRRAIHYMNPDQDALSFSYRQYRENKFIIGMSFEKMADVNFTGVNTKMGSLITFKLKGTEGALPAGEAVEEIFTHLISEAVLEIRESGSVVYD